MRRLVAIPVVAAALVAALVSAGAGGGKPTYRVDAIFDNAASLVPGNVVKIAGAPVGEVSDIRLTARRRARVQMEIEEGYAPFRSDARCVIAPESLFIGEKYVQCRPGTPRGSELRGRGGGAPTVPLARNSSTVDLDLVLSTLRLPVRQRLSILFAELGAGLAGRPKELNQVVRRANPALGAANKVLKILDDDRATLARLVERSDQVVGELADRRGDVQGFIERAGEVTDATAARRDALQEGIRRMPPLLDQLEPTADRLAQFSREATPALRNLRVAAPALRTLLRDVEPLSDAGRPAVASLRRTARVGRRAVRAAKPQVRRLRAASRLLPRTVRITDQLTASIRSSGSIEGLLTFIYYTALSTSRFDRISHIVPAYVLFNDCGTYARTPEAQCSAHFGGRAGPARTSRSRSRTPTRTDRRPKVPRAPAPAQPNRAPSTEHRAPQQPAAPRPDPSEPLPRVLPEAERQTGVPLLDYLLGP